MSESNKRFHVRMYLLHKASVIGSCDRPFQRIISSADLVDNSKRISIVIILKMFSQCCISCFAARDEFLRLQEINSEALVASNWEIVDE